MASQASYGDKSEGDIIVNRSRGTLSVIMPAHIRDYNWSKKIGVIQHELQALIDDEGGGKKLLINLNYCRWADPLPTLSILTEVFMASSNGIDVEIVFASPTRSDHSYAPGPYISSPNRLLRFLACEGFFDCINRLPLIKTSEDVKDIGTLIDLNVPPSYNNSHLIPMRVINLSKEVNAKISINKLMADSLYGIEQKLGQLVPKRLIDRLVHKIRVSLQELLLNVYEHAYSDDTLAKTVCIYGRYRRGSLELSYSEAKDNRLCLNEEAKRCPLVDKNWLSSRDGCIELFVVDRGIGMVASYERYTNTTIENKYPLVEVMKQAYLDGDRRGSKQFKPTEFGGLHLVHNVLKKESGFIRCFERNMWCGGHVPLTRAQKKVKTLISCEREYIGHAVHLRLGWNSDTDITEKWAYFCNSEASPLQRDLSLSENECLESFEWYRHRLVIEGASIPKELEHPVNTDWTMWIAPQHLMKNDILNYLEKISNLISRQPSSKKTILAITDIPSYEAEIYAAAIENLHVLISDAWPRQFASIICCTNKWRFAVSTHKRDTTGHGFSKFEKSIKPQILNSNPFPLEKNSSQRGFIIRWQKWYDSICFWNEIYAQHLINGTASGAGNLLFIPRTIDWGMDENGQDILIEGYLDFSKCTHNEVCSNILTRSLTRLAGIMPITEYQWQPLDKLTESLLRDIYTFEEYDDAESSFKEGVLNIGSVLVTGKTANDDLSNSHCIHFFKHKSCKIDNSVSSLLYWIPALKVCKDDKPMFKRIGKTPAIAVEGWKSFEIPRHNLDNQTIPARTPEESYNDFQNTSPIIMKLGHWYYEGHHDILTVNIHEAIDTSFSGKSHLALFIMSRIFPFIGICEGDISSEWKKHYVKYVGGNSIDTLSPYGLVVYRSHPSTTAIFRLLLSTLSDNGKSKAISRTFPVLPIRKHWGGTTFLFPPMVLDLIENAMHIDNDSTRRVMIFDDAMITGRTINNFKSAIKSRGAKHVKTFIILNRLRQPADNPEKSVFEFYWRADLPTIGRGESCSLCQSLRTIQSFKCTVASHQAIKHLETWIRQWKKSSPIYSWSSGIRPVMLTNPDIGKDYCYRKGYTNKATGRPYISSINITHSTGKLLHISEIYAMTGRDDYWFKKISEEPTPEIKIEIAASQFLMFGSEFSQKIKMSLLSLLLNNLCQLKIDNSPHISLALITIMGGVDTLEPEARNFFIREVSSTAKSGLYNYPFIILLSYLFTLQPIKAFELGDDDYIYPFLRILNTDPWPLSLRLNSLYRSILSKFGNAHTEPIPRLIDSYKEHSFIKSSLLRDALDSSSHIVSIIDGLPNGLVRRDSIAEYNYHNKELHTIVQTLIVESTKTIIIAEDELSCDKTIRIHELFSEFLEHAKGIVSCYFLVFQNISDKESLIVFKTIISDIVNKIVWDETSKQNKHTENTTRIIRVHSRIICYNDPLRRETWIPWNLEIYYLVKDIMLNAAHVPSTFLDPWEDGKSSDQAHMWIKVEFHDRFLKLHFKNLSNITSADLLTKIMAKSQRFEFLKQIGGGISADGQDHHGITTLVVSIPYAGNLTTGD